MTTVESDILAAIDWLGAEIDCRDCAHRALSEVGRCQIMHACVNDRYALRINRFFDWNKELADEYLTHPHFEVRAIAAKSATVFRLPPLLKDEDETVRWNAVRRLPNSYLKLLRNDPHREVRIRVANMIDERDLLSMSDDCDYYVRLVVARRLPTHLLPLMFDDTEAQVRRLAAQRSEDLAVMRLIRDRDALVRLEVARKLDPQTLRAMIGDQDWRVRYEVALRGDTEWVSALCRDVDEMVRECATARMTAKETPSVRGER